MITRIMMSGSANFCGGEAEELYQWINETQLTEIRHVAYTIVAPITIGIGIIGNILNLLVLITKPFLKGGTRLYLTALAISDLSVMLTVIPMVVRWNYSQSKRYEAAMYYAHVEIFLNNTFIASSVFIVVCLTVERYFSVCLPTMFRSMHTIKIARMAIFGSFATAVIVSAPLTVMKDVCLIPQDTENTCRQWDFHENNTITGTIYWTIYLFFSEFLIRFGPCLVLAVLNILIIRKFRKITAKRKIFREALTKNRNGELVDCANKSKYKKALRNKKYQEEKRLIVLLRAIVVLFFVTMSPSAILSLLYTEMQEAEFGFQVFRAAANNLELANFSLNFYVYFLCSKEFRAALIELFTGCITCEDVHPAETCNADNGRNNTTLKVVKLTETSDYNSTGDKFCFEFSERSFSMGNDTLE